MTHGHLRQLLNYTQEYVATELGISPKAHGMLGNGKATMEVSQLLLLAKVLDIDPMNCFPPNRL
jgi:transcriptional regulator with XRE-family HTH domain